MSARRLRLLTVALCAGYFLVLLDVTVVNVALPSIGDDLASLGRGLAWIIDAYTVPLAALLLAAGGLGDRLGHRRIVVVGFVGFAAASASCSLAGSLAALSIWRAIQGMAAAVMLPGTLALTADLYAGAADRARAIGTWAAVGALALPAGPLPRWRLPLPLLGRPAGRLCAAWGHWRIAAAGRVIGAAGFAVMAAVTSTDGVMGSIGLGLWGVGLGLLAPAVVGATVASLPDRSGLASGLSNTARQLGGAFGVALFATLAGPATATGFGDAVRLVLVGCATCFAAAAVLCIATGRSLLHNRAHDDSSRARDLGRAR
jgi:hypothetical protein